MVLLRDLFEEYDLDNYATEPDLYLDVPFVPTEEDVVNVMLKMARAGPKDLLYDLGCGDGRIVIAAARDRGTSGIGIDADPARIADAMEEAGWAGVEHMVDFLEDDIFNADFSEATIVTLYLLQTVNMRLRPRILDQLRPGTRVISHAFDMGDWKPDETRSLGGISIHKWIVPARIGGVHDWTGEDGREYRIELKQKFQETSGEAWIDGEPARLAGAALTGNRLELTIEHEGEALGFTLDFLNGRLHSTSGPVPE